MAKEQSVRFWYGADENPDPEPDLGFLDRNL